MNANHNLIYDLTPPPKLKELNVHIQHEMFWAFNKNKPEIAQKISSVCSQSVTTDSQVRNWFLMFRSRDTSFRVQHRPGR